MKTKKDNIIWLRRVFMNIGYMNFNGISASSLLKNKNGTQEIEGFLSREN